MVERLKALGMDSCAVTDHGVMYGVIDFYSAMKDAGMHPVIGCEAYVCRDRTDKSYVSREYSHLILLCENNTGYQNLMYLCSQGFLTGYYYKPRMDYQLIREHSRGADLPLRLPVRGPAQAAPAGPARGRRGLCARRCRTSSARRISSSRCMDHGIREERIVLPRLVALARELDVPLVATNDCHYLEEKDADAQEVLMCIQTGKTLEDTSRMRMETRQLYVKSEAEMRALFAAYPDAVDNAGKIARRCQVEFDVRRSPACPAIPCPRRRPPPRCWSGCAGRAWPASTPTPGRRTSPTAACDYELDTIGHMGYVDYFLIVWDFIHYAKSQRHHGGAGAGQRRRLHRGLFPGHHHAGPPEVQPAL